jgi:hypothetical protein
MFWTPLRAWSRAMCLASMAGALAYAEAVYRSKLSPVAASLKKSDKD